MCFILKKARKRRAEGFSVDQRHLRYDSPISSFLPYSGGLGRRFLFACTSCLPAFASRREEGGGKQITYQNQRLFGDPGVRFSSHSFRWNCLYLHFIRMYGWRILSSLPSCARIGVYCVPHCGELCCRSPATIKSPNMCNLRTF